MDVHFDGIEAGVLVALLFNEEHRTQKMPAAFLSAKILIEWPPNLSDNVAPSCAMLRFSNGLAYARITGSNGEFAFFEAGEETGDPVEKLRLRTSFENQKELSDYADAFHINPNELNRDKGFLKAAFSGKAASYFNFAGKKRRFTQANASVVSYSSDNPTETQVEVLVFRDYQKSWKAGGLLAALALHFEEFDNDR
jgi:hypothetical protein